MLPSHQTPLAPSRTASPTAAAWFLNRARSRSTVAILLAMWTFACLLATTPATLHADDDAAGPVGAPAGEVTGPVITIFPREYGRTENGETRIGEYGKLVMTKTAEGDEIEVVEFAPSRSLQREKNLALFSTYLDPKRKLETLERPLTQWNGAAWLDGTFKQPDEIDRTAYRRDSTAYDAKVASLYETAQLDARLSALAALARTAMRDGGLPDSLKATVDRSQSWAAMQAWRVGLADRLTWYEVCQAELDGIPLLQASLAANATETAAIEAKLKTLDATIADLETQIGVDKLDGVRPKGDERWRARDVARFNAYDCRADLEWLAEDSAARQARIALVVKTLAPPLQEDLALDDAALTAAAAAPSPELLARLKASITAGTAETQALLNAAPDAATGLRQAVTELDAAFAGAPADLKDKAAASVAAYRTAFGAGGALPSVEAALKVQAAAVAEIKTFDFGRYHVVMWSRMEGIENSLGTPINVTVCGVTRTLYGYNWPDSENIHPIEFDVEVREAASRMAAYVAPLPAHAIDSMIGSYKAYNQRRMKGWTFAGDDTLHALARAVFGPDGKGDPQQRLTAEMGQQRKFNDTLQLSISLEATRRRAGRGMGGPDASLDALLVDAIEIEPVAEAPLVLRQVIPQKNWHRPGESNAFMAWMHNRTDASQTGTLTTWTISGLDDRVQIDERPVTLAPHSFARVVVPWTSAAAAPLWGQTVRMRLTVGDQSTEAEEVFSIHPDTFAVMMAGGHRGYDVYRQEHDYRNHAETFSATFCDSVYMLPDDLMLPYVRSMSDVKGDVLSARAETQRNHKLGVGSVHYLSPLCTGWKSYHMYLEHPEWFPGRLAWTEDMAWNHETYARRLIETAKGDGDMSWDGGKDKTYNLLHLEQPINFASRELFDNLVEDLITYSSVVDWDGTRWDGGPMLYFPTDVLGRPVVDPLTGGSLQSTEARKVLAARQLKELKERMRKVHPQWVYGNNGDTFNYGATFLSLQTDPPPITDDPHYQEFMEGGGSYMDEGWMNAYIYGDNRNKVEDYLKLAFKQAMGMKAAGGYLQCFSPNRDGAGHFCVDDIYYTLLPHLAGATYYGKLSASPYSEDGPIVFITRFSEFFLNQNLKPLPDAAKRLDVDAPNVWFHEAARIEPLGPDHVRVIVPIINRHPRERFYDTNNRFSELPRPITQPFTMTVRPPDGFENAEATVWDLTCEPRTAARQVEATKNTDSLSFQLDGLSLFRVAVIDYRRAK